MIDRNTTLQLTISLATLLILTGCTAEPPVPAFNLIQVQGTVTRNGEPVPRTIVLFIPVAEEGTHAKGVTDQRGRFRLMHESNASGAEAGKYKVVLQTPRVRLSTGDSEVADAAYSDPKTTPLQAHVSPDAATVHLELNRRN